MKRNNLIFLSVVIFIVVAALILFGKLSQRPNERTSAEFSLSPTEQVLQRDLSIDYPQSPKAVVKYYAQLSQAMYDEQNTDEQIKRLAHQSRRLFDSELYNNQTDEDYLARLMREIENDKKDGRKIMSFSLSAATDVEYQKTDDGEYATLYCNYPMQKEGAIYSDKEHFILRKDGEGHWKILGWQNR